MTMLFGTFSTKDNGFVVDAGTLLANIGPVVVNNSLKALAISKLLVIVFPLMRKLLLFEFLPFFMQIIVLRTFQVLFVSEMLTSISLLKYQISAFRKSEIP